jgi:hypothetical protein
MIFQIPMPIVTPLKIFLYQVEKKAIFGQSTSKISVLKPYPE